MEKEQPLRRDGIYLVEDENGVWAAVRCEKQIGDREEREKVEWGLWSWATKNGISGYSSKWKTYLKEKP